MRGEHAKLAQYEADAQGSSPHARGALVVEPCQRVVVGIIPACAGSTRLPVSASPWTWDHPRMRGEHGRVANIVPD